MIAKRNDHSIRLPQPTSIMLKLYASILLLFSLAISGRTLPVSEFSAMHHLNESPVELSDTPNLICKPGDVKQESGTLYKCQPNGQQQMQMVCADGMTFNDKKSSCESVNKRGGQSGNSSYDCRGKQDGFYVDDNDASMFHQCTNGYPVDYKCPDSQMRFIAEHNACALVPEDKPEQQEQAEEVTEKDDGKSTGGATRKQRSPSGQHQLEEVAKQKHIDLHVIETTTLENFDVWID